jgi:itaconyl-CoA hydratase
MRLYEQFTVGDVYRSAVGRTVTETDNLLFTMLTLNTNELHFNVEAAKQTEWQRPLVNSLFTLALVHGLSVPDTTQSSGVNLGWTEIRLPHPVFVGDTIWAETEVTSVRESASRPAHGVVAVRTRGINQHRDVVCKFSRTFLAANEAATRSGFPGTDEDWSI